MFSFLRAKSKKQEGLCCVNFNEEGVAVAYAKSNEQGKISLERYDFLDCADTRQCASALAGYVKQQQLQDVSCDVILNPDDYHLMLIDKPPVQEEEIKKAAYFLTKDLINFPIEEAAIDTFEIPVAYGKKPKIYVVITRLPLLSQIAQWTKKANLSLCYIDIAELALLNFFTSKIWPAEKDTALLFTSGSSMHLMIIKDQFIRFIRKIGKISAQNMENPNSLKHIITEIQKSFDYYQTQIAQCIPGKLLLPPELFSENHAQHLHEQLGVPADIFNINRLFSAPEKIELPFQHRFLNVLGECLNIEAVLQSNEEKIIQQPIEKSDKPGETAD